MASREHASDTPSASPRLAELGLLMMVVIWGFNFSVLKVGLADFHPLVFNALRFPLAALVLTVALLASGDPRLPDRRDVLRIVGLAILGHVLYQLLFIFGMDRTRAGNASLVLASAPVHTALLSGLLRHDRIPPRAWLGIVAAFGGIVLVVGTGPGEISFGSRTFTGDLLILGAAVLWALYTVFTRGMVRKYGSLPVTTWMLWVGAALLLLIGAPELTRLGPARPLAWAALVYAGVLGIGVSQMLWYHGVAVIGSTRTAVFQNLVPILALVVAWLWLSEVPTPGQIAGAAVILGGVTVVRRSARTRR